MASEILNNVKAAMKDAMRAKEKERLATIRLIQADFKRVEVDERIELDDDRVIAILDKMVKQRRDSVRQYQEAGRDELAAIELAEIDVIQTFLPTPLTASEISAMIDAAIAETGAESMRDMGKVVGLLKGPMQGRADMAVVSKLVKDRLS
ncbi:MAG TPA: GatB/YqeY domain-containing protein [Pseudomonadales bacterium]|nr:GatB/YqeY domain-containing protein [Pseudomonadales bacterium]